MADFLGIIRNLYTIILFFEGYWIFSKFDRFFRALLSFMNYKTCFNVSKMDPNLKLMYALMLLVKNSLVYYGIKHEIPPIISWILFPSVVFYYSIRTVTMEKVGFYLGPWPSSIVIILLSWYRVWNLGPIESSSIMIFSAVMLVVEESVPGYQIALDFFLIILFFRCVRQCLSDPRYAMFPFVLWYFVELSSRIECLNVWFRAGYVLGLLFITIVALYRFGDERFAFIAGIAVGCYYLFFYGVVLAKLLCPEILREQPYEAYEPLYKLFELDDDALKLMTSLAETALRQVELGQQGTNFTNYTTQV